MTSHERNAAGMGTLDLLLALADLSDLIERHNRLGWRARRRDALNVDGLRVERAAVNHELQRRAREADARAAWDAELGD